MQSALAIAFELAPSRILVVATGMLAVIALGCIAASGVLFVFKLGLMLAVVVFAAVTIFASCRHRGRIAWLGDSRWCWQRDGTESFPTLRSARVLGPLLVLRFDAPCSVVLLPDNIDRETARRLRVRLAARSLI